MGWFFAIAVLVASGASLLAMRRRAAYGESAAAQVERASEILEVADDHYCAYAQDGRPFDGARAKELALDVVRIMDDVCARVPDRHRLASWHALRARANDLVARVDSR